MNWMKWMNGLWTDEWTEKWANLYKFHCGITWHRFNIFTLTLQPDLLASCCNKGHMFHRRWLFCKRCSLLTVSLDSSYSGIWIEIKLSISDLTFCAKLTYVVRQLRKLAKIKWRSFLQLSTFCLRNGTIAFNQRILTVACVGYFLSTDPRFKYSNQTSCCWN